MDVGEGSAFLLHDGSSLYVPPATIHAGWGNSVSIHAVGEEFKPLPDQLMLTSYSYLEDKLYHGLFDLPYDQIATHFAKGFAAYDTGNQESRRYEVITAGVAPGGVITVWLEGLGKCKEVFFGHAQELDRDFHQALRLPLHVNREQYRESELRESAATDPRVLESVKHIPFGLWDTYRTPYAWHLLLEGLPTPKYIASIHYYNGEYESWPWPLSTDAQAEQRPVPSSVMFFVKFPAEEFATQYVVEFNEQEMLRTFQRLGSDGRSIDLRLRQGTRLEVSLRNDREEIALVDFDYELYKSKRKW